MKVLGLDGGIASIGWTVLELGDDDGHILGAGTWMFDTPETDKERRLTSEIRREKRGARRVIRRRRQRMAQIRGLFSRYGVLSQSGPDALRQPGLDPWELRVAGLDRALSPVEFAVALGHIARHRGFKSTAKQAPAANAAEEGKMKLAMAGTLERLARWRSVAEMLVRDEKFAGRCHNREGDYSRSVRRDDLDAETRLLFSRQRALGNDVATAEFLEDFRVLAFTQRPLQDSADRVGFCPFETDQRRAAKHCYSFELFRFLSRLTTLEIIDGRIGRRLTPEEIAAAAMDFGKTAKISFAALRKKIRLAADARFDRVKPDEESRDVVSRTGEAAPGSAALRKVLGDGPWASLLKTPERLDRIAEVLAFREDKDRIRLGLEETGLESLLVQAIMAALDSGQGRLDRFSGAGHISAKAARAVLPQLAQGKVYSEACTAVGYTHTDSTERNAFASDATGKAALAAIIKDEKVSPDLVGSPVARKALLEALKQVKAVIERFGMPDAIHVELARDVGKSIEERRKIEIGVEKRSKYRDRLRDEFAELIGRPPERNSDEMLRFELWREQNGRCLYTDTAISPAHLVAADNSVQVDHILPWSRFGDDSFVNKTLCLAAANQNKRGRTPHEWILATAGNDAWEQFAARVEAIQYMKGIKKRNYLLKDGGEEVAKRFRNRNLVDTRWATRLLAEALRAMYPADEGQRRVFTRPGAITNRLRQGWGLQWMKKDAKGERIADDRHHALDAIVVAATTESMLQRLTRAFQDSEAKGDRRDFSRLDEPWPGFRQQVMDTVGAVFVARAERRRARGEAHAATIRQIAIRDGGAKVFERKRVDDLKPADLERVKDPDRNLALIRSLGEWIADGKPAGTRPLSPQGDPIAKVRLLTTKKVDVEVRGGTAERGDMAGVDVFRKIDAKGRAQFHLVPLYPHQIATQETPPDRAIVAHKPESEWTLISPEFEFLFRLVSHCYVVLTKSDGEIVEGYFKEVNRSDAGIVLASDRNLHDRSSKIGTKTLLSLQKFQIDRLGNRSEISREVRTWRGKVCT